MRETLTQHLGSSWGGLLSVAISTLAVYLSVILYTRVAGLRSFAKMSSFDFAMTVAVGSLMAGAAASSSISLLDGLAALGLLFAAQAAVGLARRRLGASRLVDNRPVLLVMDGEYLDENLRRTRVTRADVRSKLRELGVCRRRDVRALVLETTGDFSVLTDTPIDAELLDGVVGAGDQVLRTPTAGS